MCRLLVAMALQYSPTEEWKTDNASEPMTCQQLAMLDRLAFMNNVDLPFLDDAALQSTVSKREASDLIKMLRNSSAFTAEHPANVENVDVLLDPLRPSANESATPGQKERLASLCGLTIEKLPPNLKSERVSLAPGSPTRQSHNEHADARAR